MDDASETSRRGRPLPVTGGTRLRWARLTLAAGMLAASIAVAGPPVLAAAADAGGIGAGVPGPVSWQEDGAAGEPEGAAATEADRMATVVAVLNQQGEESADALARVAGFEVDNPLPPPAPVIDPGIELTATAVADATATASAEADASAAAATEVALSVQATVEASATAAATERETERKNARATEAAEARVASATAAAVARDATPPSAPAVAITAPPDDDQGSLVSDALAAAGNLATRVAAVTRFALAPAFAVLLGLVIWRRRREPFVLKAKPAGS